MKILHFADVHCRDSEREEVGKCLAAVVDAVVDKPIDLIVIAGDIFDSRNVKLESKSAKLIFRFVDRLARYAPVSIVFGTPSHEGEATEALQYIKAKYPVHVSARPEQYFLMPDNSFAVHPEGSFPKLVISAVPQPTKQFFQSHGSIDSTNKEIADAMSNLFAGFGARAAMYNCPHLLTGHFSISGAFLNPNQVMIGYDIEISRAQIELANADLVCLGHIHYAQQIGKNIFYSGSIYRMDVTEQEDKGFYLHDIDPAHGLQNSLFIKTPTRRLYKLTHDFTVSQDNFRVPFTPEMYEAVKDAIVKVELRVYEDDVAKIDRNSLGADLLGAKEVTVRVVRVPRTNVRSETILKLQSLRDKIVEMGRLRGERVAESILLKADLLESQEPDKIIAGVGRVQRSLE